MTEVLLSSGAEGNQNRSSILCCKWLLQGVPILTGFAKHIDYLKCFQRGGQMCLARLTETNIFPALGRKGGAGKSEQCRED